MGMIIKKRCRNCRKLFIPDHRNHDRQKYCERAECCQASKAASQRKWLNKPENKDYFRGKLNVQRVQRWRKQNPEYWKKKSPKRVIALQDLLELQTPVIIGLISNFIGSALQDDIAETLLRMQ